MVETATACRVSTSTDTRSRAASSDWAARFRRHPVDCTGCAGPLTATERSTGRWRRSTDAAELGVDPGGHTGSRPSDRRDAVHLPAPGPDARRPPARARPSARAPDRDAIIPAAVGVDIGCGMIAVRTVQRRPARARSTGCTRRSRGRSPAAGPAQKIGFERRPADRRARSSPVRRRRPTRRALAAAAGLAGLGQSLHRTRRSTRPTRGGLFLHSGSRGVGNKLAQKHIRIAQERAAGASSTCPTGPADLSRASRSSTPTSRPSAGRSGSPTSTARR